MSGAGLARAVQRAHQERKVASRCLNQELLVHIVEPSHVEPVQTPGVELMREVPLDPLTTLPLQSFAAIAPYPTPVVIDGLLLRLSLVPVARAIARATPARRSASSRRPPGSDRCLGCARASGSLPESVGPDSTGS